MPLASITGQTPKRQNYSALTLKYTDLQMIIICVYLKFFQNQSYHYNLSGGNLKHKGKNKGRFLPEEVGFCLVVMTQCQFEGREVALMAKGWTMNKAIAKATKSTGSSRSETVPFQARPAGEAASAGGQLSAPGEGGRPHQGGASRCAVWVRRGRWGRSQSWDSWVRP